MQPGLTRIRAAAAPHDSDPGATRYGQNVTARRRSPQGEDEPGGHEHPPDCCQERRQRASRERRLDHLVRGEGEEEHHPHVVHGDLEGVRKGTVPGRVEIRPEESDHRPREQQQGVDRDRPIARIVPYEGGDRPLVIRTARPGALPLARAFSCHDGGYMTTGAPVLSASDAPR
jgi:hypothetical protein